jgi:hypothetical protein
MGARQAVGIVHRRDIAAGADRAALADAYAAEHLPVGAAAARGHVDEVIAPTHTRERIAARWRPAVTPRAAARRRGAAAAQRHRGGDPRRRRASAGREGPSTGLTMDAIAGARSCPHHGLLLLRRTSARSSTA